MGDSGPRGLLGAEMTIDRAAIDNENFPGRTRAYQKIIDVCAQTDETKHFPNAIPRQLPSRPITDFPHICAAGAREDQLRRFTA